MLGHEARFTMLDSISHSPWFLIGLSLAMAIGFSSYTLYSLKRGRLLNGMSRKPICRDEDPSCYWFYMAIYSFAACFSIYMFVTLSYQFIKGLPLKL